MSAPTPAGGKSKVPGLTVLGSIVALAGMVTALLLIQGANAHVYGIVTAMFVPVILGLLGLYSTQQGNSKADQAKAAAADAKDTASSVASTVGEIHHLVNGGLTDRLAEVVRSELSAAGIIPPQAPPAGADQAQAVTP